MYGRNPNHVLFRDHGYFPPWGEWPGGHRYGLEVRRHLAPGRWSAADRQLAAKHNIKLPEVVTQIVQIWWDQPRPEVRETSSPEIAQWVSEVEPLDDSPRVTTTTQARRWGLYWIHPDPLRALRSRHPDHQHRRSRHGPSVSHIATIR